MEPITWFVLGLNVHAASSLALPRPQIGLPGLGAGVGTNVGAAAATGINVPFPPLGAVPPLAVPPVAPSNAKTSTSSRSAATATASPANAVNVPNNPAAALGPGIPVAPAPGSAANLPSLPQATSLPSIAVLVPSVAVAAPSLPTAGLTLPAQSAVPAAVPSGPASLKDLLSSIEGVVSSAIAPLAPPIPSPKLSVAALENIPGGLSLPAGGVQNNGRTNLPPTLQSSISQPVLSPNLSLSTQAPSTDLSPVAGDVSVPSATPAAIGAISTPSLPADTSPSVPALPDADSLPLGAIISGAQPSPASKQQSFFQLTLPTTVAMTDTAALASLATLPANAGSSGLPSQLPATPPSTPTLPSVSSGPALPQAPVGLSDLPAPLSPPPSVSDVLDQIGVGLVQSIASAMVQLMNILAGAADPAALLGTGALSDIQALTGTGLAVPPMLAPSLAPTLLPAAGMLSNPSTFATVTDAVSLTDILRPSSSATTTSVVEDPNKHKRALPGLPNLPGLQSLAAGLGGGLPIGAQIQTPSATVGGGVNVQPSPSVPTGSVPLPSTKVTNPALLPSITGLPNPPLPSAPGPEVVPSGLAAPQLPSLPIGQALPATSLLPGQYYDAINAAPIVGSATLPVAAGSTVLSMVTSIPIPSDLPALMQGAKDAAVANIAETVTNVPLIGQAERVLAVLQLLGIMNISQLGSLATLTNLPAVQSAVALINEPDLITVVHVLESRSTLYSTAADGLLSNVIAFVQVVEKVAPLVKDLKAAVAYIILDQLGLTATKDVFDGTLVNSLPGGSGGA